MVYHNRREQSACLINKLLCKDPNIVCSYLSEGFNFEADMFLFATFLRFINANDDKSPTPRSKLSQASLAIINDVFQKCIEPIDDALPNMTRLYIIASAVEYYDQSNLEALLEEIHSLISSDNFVQ